LLAVGAVSARKGYDVLIQALAPLAHLDWRLVVAGAADRDADAAAALEGLIARLGLADRIRLSGAVVPATLARFYDTADIFVMPSLLEGHAMPVT
ncbi:glycosyltransferase, partial [Enterococcus faecium]|uniref:glycosyltransferase n=1 Tax=Enterococcus faecium TaxID=1352 RepID=UPI003F433B70